MNLSKSSAIIAFVVLASISDQCFGGHADGHGGGGPWIKRTKAPTTTTEVPTTTTIPPTTTVMPTVLPIETTTVLPEIVTTTAVPIEIVTTVKPTVAELETTTKRKHQYPMRKRTTEAPITTTLAPETTTALPTVADLETTTAKQRYPGKKPRAAKYRPSKKNKTDVPTPTPAALETTTVLLLLLPTTTMRESIPEATTKSIDTTVRQESPPSPVITMETEAPPKLETTLPPAPAKKTRRPRPTPALPRVDFSCRKKEDGYYVDPKDKCSSSYYACVGGLARKMECGSEIGKDHHLVYEPETGRCEHRDESYRCTGQRKTTKAVTKPPPPPIVAKLDIDCEKFDDGWYSDPLKKCSHVFYSCSNKLGSKFECPGQMYFDDESKACLPHQDVVACAGKKPPTKPPKPTTPAPPKEKLAVDCTDKPSGQYEDPEKKCSSIYYVCSNGDGFKRTCPDGTKYDVKKERCEFYDEVVACVGPKPATTVPISTAAPIPSLASLLSTEYNCTGKPDVSYLPPGKKCSNHYFRCVGGSTYKAFCPRDLYYDIKNDLCDRYDNLFVCSGKYPTSPPPTTPAKAPEKIPIDCATKPDGDYPDPEKECSSIYYSCAGGLGLDIGHKRQCAPTTYFDKDLGICDIRDNVPACSKKPRPETTKPTPRSKIDVTKSPYSCEKLTDGNYPSGKCHSKYWSCVGGATIRAECPKGTYYDREMDECGYKEEIPACGGVRPTEMIKIKENR